MRKFSNESKKRSKAIVKTILKRYSIFVWLPLLLYVFYLVGLTFCMLVDTDEVNKEMIYGIAGIFGNTVMGFCLVAELILIGFLIIECCKSFVEYIKKGTLLYDTKEIGKEIISCVRFIVKIPKKIYDRIKSEPKRFKEALDKEITKQE